MRRFHPGWAVAVVVGTALLLAGTAILLPDDPYRRLSLLDGTSYGDVRYVYERLHFDPRPVDIAIVGASRLALGIDATTLQRKLAARSLRVEIANLAIPQPGRNMDWLIVRDLLATKHPRLLILEAVQPPRRFGHPAYRIAAPRADIIDPAFWGNLSYAGDLFYLPYRQLLLLLDRIEHRLPPQPCRATDCSARRHVQWRPPQFSLLLMDKIAKREQRNARPPLLGPRWADVEFGAERIYFRRIIALARHHQVPVVILYVPQYRGAPDTQEATLYRAHGSYWNAAFLAPRAENFRDAFHLTDTGVARLADWLIPRIVAQLGSPRSGQPVKPLAGGAMHLPEAAALQVPS